MQTWMLALVLVGSVLTLACSVPPSAATGGSPKPPKVNPEPSHEEVHQHESAAAPAAAAGLVRIADPGHVCMLSNRFLGETTHVPVAVAGKTYFGCCANCAARIGERTEARNAVDPVSGRAVDKASAVLARDETNKVLYFESEATFAQMQRERATGR